MRDIRPNLCSFRRREALNAVDGMSDDCIGVFFGDILDVDASLTAADDARPVAFSRLQDGKVVFSPQVESLDDGDFVAGSSALARLFGEESVADHPRRDLRAFVG